MKPRTVHHSPECALERAEKWKNGTTRQCSGSEEIINIDSPIHGRKRKQKGRMEEKRKRHWQIGAFYPLRPLNLGKRGRDPTPVDINSWGAAICERIRVSEEEPLKRERKPRVYTRARAPIRSRLWKVDSSVIYGDSSASRAAFEKNSWQLRD